MRAAVCKEFGQPLTIENVTIAAPGPGELLIDVAACAICHSDIAYMDGAWGGPLPAIYGHEAAGHIAAIGPDTAGYSVGDAVAATLVRSCGDCYLCRAGQRHLCRGDFRLAAEAPLHSAEGEVIWQAMGTAAFAEQILVHESQVAPLPSGIPMASAALLSCGVITGFGAVTNTAAVQAGASVVVVGTGGVGINCIQGAVHAGAGVVIAIDVRDDKLAAAQRLGASAVVNSATQDAPAIVAELTGGRGADYVFVAVGNSRAIEASVPLLRPGGTLTIVGLPPTGDLISIDPADFAAAGQQLLGSKMGSANLAADIPMLADLYDQGRLELDGLVSNTFSLDEVNDAIASTKSGEAIRNVIIFDQ